MTSEREPADDPAELGTPTTEPSRPRGTDEVKDDRVRAERETRGDLAASSELAGSSEDDAATPSDEAESSYTTEREQGAAQPGAPDAEPAPDSAHRIGEDRGIPSSGHRRHRLIAW